MTNEMDKQIEALEARIDALFTSDDQHIGGGIRLILNAIAPYYDSQIQRMLCPIIELIERIERDEAELRMLDDWCDEQEAAQHAIMQAEAAGA